MAGAALYQDGYWSAADDVRLHYRDYNQPQTRKKGRPPIICLPGLTRNARDFAVLAERLCGEWRVICPDLRGRGDSAHAKDPATYTPLQYVADIEALLSILKIKRAVFIGTSLGGVLTVLLTAAKPARTVAALINDIGPEIEAAGLIRIASTAGRSQSWPTWVHAARWMSETQNAVFPDYDMIRWIAFAKNVCRLTAQGRVVLDYDMRIADAFKSAPQTADLWPVFAAMGNTPVTVVRGALSDLLSEATAKRTVKMLPNARLVTVKRVGHAPMLDEAEAVRAIDAMLKLVDT